MSNSKIIDFKKQSDYIKSFNESLNNSPIKTEGMTITTAFPPSDKRSMDFVKDCIVSSVNDDEIFLGLPDINMFRLDEIFTFQEAVNRTIQHHYDNIKGKGSYVKDFAKFQNEKFKGNLYNQPEPISLEKLQNTIENFNKPLSIPEEEEARDQSLDELSNGIRLIYYNNEYLDIINDMSNYKNLNDDSIKYLVKVEKGIEDFLNKEDLDDSDNILKKLLKNTSKNSIDNKNFEAEHENTSIDDLITIQANAIGNDMSLFKLSKDLINKRMKASIQLKELKDNSTKSKIAEYNRLVPLSELYVKDLKTCYEAKAEKFKNDSSYKNDIEEDKELVDYSKVRLEDINKSTLDNLLYGTTDVKSVKENTIEGLNNSVDNSNIPEELKGLLKSVTGDVVNKLDSKDCDCFLCEYEKQMKKLIEL